MTVSIHTDRFGRDSDCDNAYPDTDADDAPRPHRDQFAFTYLPHDVRTIFEEALLCYSADLFYAFGLMCRRTIAASTTALGDKQVQKSRAAVAEIIQIGEIDDSAAHTINHLLFGDEMTIPPIGAAIAAILLEVVKDVLYQNHVRAAKFRAAMRVRSFFAEEQNSRLTALRRPRGTTQTD